MGRSANSPSRPSVTRLLLLRLLHLLTAFTPCRSAARQAIEASVPQELHNGFRATPDPSISTFQPILADPTRNFSLGFLRVNRTQLALAVIRVPSPEPLWEARMSSPPRWGEPTELTFNGSLVISDTSSRVFWSTESHGGRVVLLNTSNLVVQSLGRDRSAAWQSFDSPTNTLVENQNFTINMTLRSSNGLYSMRLGDTFFGLYAKFRANGGDGQIYFRHRALEAKAEIVEGKGPIYARVDPDGYLGMYQTGDDSTPVDVESFNTFQRAVAGIFLRLRLEQDGNLKGYYWAGSGWVVDYQAIRAQCDLPSPCGSYGLCQPGGGCSCLDNRTAYGSESGGCGPPPESGDFCPGGLGGETGFLVLRPVGVELPYKELMEFRAMGSLGECEGACERNCSCWGAAYNNGSGSCYLVDYPIQTVVRVGDEGKAGYFKVRERAGKEDEGRVGVGAGVLLLGAGAALFAAAVGFGCYRVWRRRRGVSGSYAAEDGDLSPGRYKTLESSGSSGAIELSNR